MNLNKNNISVETNTHGEIKSIKYTDTEILHNGKKWWNKTYPMIWPVIGFSEGFLVNGKKHEIPKHGFWKKLEWNEMYENDSITQVATHMTNDMYPFSIDIQNNISIDDDEVIITTVFTNLSEETAYFHFGHHPAFNIDDDTKLKTNNRYQKILTNGKFSKDYVDQKELVNMPFGIEYDTIVSKDVDKIDESISYNGLNICVSSNDFDGVQVWKPAEAKFVCIEPWQGWGDREYDSPLEAKDKIGIVELAVGEVKKFEIKIKITKK